MQFKALTAAFATVVISAVLSSAGHAKALSPTSTTNNVNDKNQTVKVASGDTLSSIAKGHGTTYVRLFDANTNVSDPNLIFPGETLRIPSATEKLPDRLKPVAAPAPAAQPVQAASQRSTSHVTAAPAVSAPVSGVWNRIAQCESGGNWAANTGNGFYGGLQFTLSSWQSVGGSGYPNQASASEQIARAQALQARQGWGAWPVCAAELGLR
ncbi:MAG TPA: transglycosylase family protein [Candidatus Saccharimonadales bacterium]|nr:transglycosylase family protein [Candidatus Saccharimonadales bacterium]